MPTNNTTARTAITIGLAWVCAVALGGSGVGAAACIACDGAPCFSGLALSIEEPGHAPLQAGTYSLEVEFDGEMVTASCVVDASAESVSCTALETGDLYGLVIDDDDGRRTVLQIALEEPTALPETVVVRIVHDGTGSLDEEIAPKYAAADPGCDDDCEQATVHLVLQR